MNQRMTWDEAKRTYPNEWVAFVEYEKSQSSNPTGIDGVVVAHHPHRQQFHALVKKIFPQYGRMAVRYTGQRVKNPQVPFYGKS